MHFGSLVLKFEAFFPVCVCIFVDTYYVLVFTSLALVLNCMMSCIVRSEKKGLPSSHVQLLGVV